MRVRPLSSIAVLALAAAPLFAQGGQRPIPPDTEIQTTESGLKYSVLKKGDGNTKPADDDVVVVHFTGWLEDGRVFQTTRQTGKPARVRIGGRGVLKGWNEALLLMTKGERLKITMPPKLAYGDAGRPPRIGPNATLIYEVELLDILPSLKFREGNPEKQKTTKSGIKVEVLEPGEGEPPAGKTVYDIKYALWTPQGELLDCTEHTGSMITGRLEDMRLEFLKEMVPTLANGARVRLEVPPALCFGEQAQGVLPPESVTIWEIELAGSRPSLPVPDFKKLDPKKTKSTPTGLEYEILDEGEGEGGSPKMGDKVTVQYAGWLDDGT